MTDKPGAAFFGEDPGPDCPRRVVPHVAGVAALEVGYPVAAFVLVKTNDAPFHADG